MAPEDTPVDEQVIAWPALASGTHIVGRDGAVVGKVHRVIADEQKDIFSGVTYRSSLLGEKFLPAALVERITDKGVYLKVSSAHAEQEAEPYDG